MLNSHLTGVRLDRPDDIVRWHGVMQAQDYGPAKWSVGQRSTGLLDGDLDRALETGSIVRTHVLRPTWHFAARDDIRWLLALTGPRVQRHNARRYDELGLDGATRSRCEALIASALESGNRLTRAEIGRIVQEGGVDAAGQRLPYIIMHCELESVICSGGRAGSQHTYALMDERVPGPHHRFDREEALVTLVRRYLGSHGPATVKDLRWWSSLTVADINKGLTLLGTEVESRAVDGLTLWALATDVASGSAQRRAHLLQAYDELIVGYTESRFFGDRLAASASATWKNRSLPTGVVIIGSEVAGHWKRTVKKASVAVEVVTYELPKPRDAQAVEAAAENLGRFLNRQVTVEVRQI